MCLGFHCIWNKQNKVVAVVFLQIKLVGMDSQCYPAQRTALAPYLASYCIPVCHTQQVTNVKLQNPHYILTLIILRSEEHTSELQSR